MIVCNNVTFLSSGRESWKLQTSICCSTGGKGDNSGIIKGRKGKKLLHSDCQLYFSDMVSMIAYNTNQHFSCNGPSFCLTYYHVIPKTLNIYLTNMKISQHERVM